MIEFDIFVPLSKPDGRRVRAQRITFLKKELVRQFGGVTYFPQRTQGLWKVGNYTFRDRIVIFRVIARPGRATTGFFRKLKLQMERELSQKNILIISRAIKIV